MTKLATIVFPLLLVAGIGCVGSAPDSPAPKPSHSLAARSYNLVDKNHDGHPDCVDLDGDGACDFGLGGTCTDPLIDTNGDGVPDGLDLDCDGAIDIAWCDKPLVDTDGDGVPDGLDLDCDGMIDVDLPDPGKLCIPDLIDSDGDGVPDGIDVDCDGTADVDLNLCVPAPIDSDGDGKPMGSTPTATARSTSRSRAEGTRPRATP